jgi:penicillin-binding protein 1B
MALGTAEATPLQVATGYTIFANLGDKVAPIAINRITNGEGKTLNALVGEKKKVLQPDVAFIMNDIMKDVINKGTAYEAKAWGFKNVEGKTAIAGKTGTSRDGWFVGYTPEIVCVVYVGFDDNDDLGMKGSDSAMPIWADFMREALNQHPDWNGDWQMPASVRKAEIDTRNGKLLRDLTDVEAETVKIQQMIANTNANTNSPDSFETAPDIKDIYITEVAAEFRRVELFVSGTVPNKILLPTDEANLTESETTEPSPTATPFTPREEAQQDPQNNQNSLAGSKDSEPDLVQNITLMICPLTGMRATVNCPNKKPQTFVEGEQPQDFCTFHVKPPG